MAKSNAIRQREKRQRAKERVRAAPDQAADFAQASFAKFMASGDAKQQLDFIDETLDSIGLGFRLPLSHDGDPDWKDEWEGFAVNRGALGRAERAVGGFIDCARTLAGLINQHKLRAIESAITEIEKRPSKRGLAEYAKLSGIRDRLRKETREAFPAFQVKGELDRQ